MKESRVTSNVLLIADKKGIPRDERRVQALFYLEGKIGDKIFFSKDTKDNPGIPLYLEENGSQVEGKKENVFFGYLNSAAFYSGVIVWGIKKGFIQNTTPERRNDRRFQFSKYTTLIWEEIPKAKLPTASRKKYRRFCETVGDQSFSAYKVSSNPEIPFVNENGEQIVAPAHFERHLGYSNPKKLYDAVLSWVKRGLIKQLDSKENFRLFTIEIFPPGLPTQKMSTPESQDKDRQELEEKTPEVEAPTAEETSNDYEERSIDTKFRELKDEHFRTMVQHSQLKKKVEESLAKMQEAQEAYQTAKNEYETFSKEFQQVDDVLKTLHKQLEESKEAAKSELQKIIKIYGGQAVKAALRDMSNEIPV